MKKLLIVLLTLTLIMTAGCGAQSSSDSGGGTNVIKIATVTPLSGAQAAVGESIKNGAQMALEERKDEFTQLGFDLQIAPQDDQADPKVGVSVAQKLIVDDDILGVVGHWNSGVAIPSSEVYAQENLAMVSPANTAVDVTDRGLANVNRICIRDDAQGPAGADYAYNELGAKTAFIIHDKTTYGQGVADEWRGQYEAGGGTVLGYEGITQGESDFSAVEELVRAADPDIIYFGGIYPEGSLLIKQLNDKGIDVKFMGADGMDSAEVITIAGDAAIGTYYTSAAADINATDAGKAFAEKYAAKFSKQPEAYSSYGYDAMNVMLDAIAKTINDNGGEKPTRDQVTVAVRATSGFQGVAVNVTFDDKGDNKEAMVYVLTFETASYPSTVVKTIPAGDYLK
ncbi:MAG TPA: branched-chain amino acid ABC transporter substrate-binding protein [Anaerovoracaceae bacterium]|nr:branched-chain amino acid ABC transporter substrate-binding protein [Anaerovoracaceae bacterium]